MWTLDGPTALAANPADPPPSKAINNAAGQYRTNVLIGLRLLDTVSQQLNVHTTCG
jgi:hypothetical protein